ncbi:MAG: hypothetical protein WCO37_01025 [Bacteroidota bacterium]
MRKVLFLLTVLCFGVLVSSSSCGKKSDPKVEITVVDSLNKAIQGAKVRITSKTYNASSIIDQNATTDIKGKAYFTFKLEAILEVIASGKNNKIGRDYIQLEIGKTTEKTITIK